MKTMHTPEPWKIGAMESGQVAIDGAGGEEVTGWIDPEDARRIVACVNACAGLDIEKLETTYAEGAPLWQFVRDMVAERDQLLAALEGLLVLADNGVESWRQEWDQARAAIAAVKAEGKE